MVRKISYIAISIVLVIAGSLAFAKVNYLERSIRIFKMNTSEQYREGRERFHESGYFRERDEFDSDHRSRSGSQQPFDQQIPDSVRSGHSSGESFISDDEDLRDTLTQNFTGLETKSPGQMKSGGVTDGLSRHADYRYSTMKKVRLSNVGLFLCVFAAFTVAGIWADKLCVSIYKKIRHQ